jgi:hypothetical protein
MQSCTFLYLDKKPVLNLTPGVAAPPGEVGGGDRVALPAEGGVAARRPSHLDPVRSGQQHQVRYCTLITTQRESEGSLYYVLFLIPILGDGMCVHCKKGNRLEA